MSRIQVKLFGPEINRHTLEEKINTYLSTVEAYWIDNVSFTTTRTLLPTGEFQLFWYGMITQEVETVDEEN